MPFLTPEGASRAILVGDRADAAAPRQAAPALPVGGALPGGTLDKEPRGKAAGEGKEEHLLKSHPHTDRKLTGIFKDWRPSYSTGTMVEFCTAAPGLR